MKKKQKGFTLVELLVVIAILAVLATVSILGYSSFTKKAQISNDESLAAQLNLILQGDEQTNGKPDDFIEVLTILSNNGFIVQNLNPTANGYYFAYDASANKILLFNSATGKVTYPANYDDTNKANWYVSVGTQEEAELVGNKGAGLYFENDIETVALNSLVSVDTGVYKCTTLTMNSTAANSVLLKGSIGTLNLTAENGDVAQYGSIQTANITAVKASSFHIYGYVENLSLTKGHIQVEEKGYIKYLSGNGTGTKTITNNGQVGITKSSLDSITVSGIETGIYADETSKTLEYTISSVKDLEEFRDQVNGGRSFKGVKVVLTTDLDISDRGWAPIGRTIAPFVGTFDGQNHTIYGLNNTGYLVVELDKFETNSAKNEGVVYGFFGVIGAESDDVTIKNITLSNVKINISGSNILGGLVGADRAATKDSAGKSYSYSGTITIENVTVDGSITSTNTSGSTVGGVIGKAYTTGKSIIKNCINKADIASELGESKVAGVLGFTKNGDLDIEECKNYGTIKSSTYVSGVCLYAFNSNGCPDIYVTIKDNHNGGILYCNSKSTKFSYVAGAATGSWGVKDGYKSQNLKSLTTEICTFMNEHYIVSGNTNEGKLYYNGTIKTAVNIVNGEQTSSTVDATRIKQELNGKVWSISK